MGSDVINLVATCVSAIAACISTYFAARAIKDARDGRREDFEASRPFLGFSGFGLKRPLVAKALSSEKDFLDPRFARIEGLISNRGKRHASNVSGVVLLIPVKKDASYGAYKTSIADDISPGASWMVETAKIQIIPDDFPGVEDAPDYFDPGFFVFVCVSYEDVLSSKKYKQTSFMRWAGVSGGVISGKLVAGSREEFDSMAEHHSKFLAPYLSEVPNGSLAKSE